MSSDLFVLFDSSVFSDSFSPIDNIFQENYEHNPTSQIQEMGNLSLSQMSNGYEDLSALLQVKTEDPQLPHYPAFDYNHNNSFFANYGEPMKMSFSSSNCFEGKSSLFYPPQYDALMESPYIQSSSSPENSSSSSSAHMRRICSAGDLQSMKTSMTRQRLSCSPLGTDNTFMEEANSKVRRYSPEERKERIHRYRTKRALRNFNKTIKYACRKTLADSRPRIRGRFARNDEAGEIHKTATFHAYEEDEDDFWMEGLHQHDQEQDVEALFKSYRVQYYGSFS